jgi:hypothetical protein
MKMEKKGNNSILKIRVDDNLAQLFEERYTDSKQKTRKLFLKSLLTKQENNELFDKKILPSVDEKRLSWLSTRITKTDKDLIYERFESSNEKQLGRFLANCVIQVPIQIQNIIKSDQSVLVELKKIGVNINQIAIRANQLDGVDQVVCNLLNNIHSELIKLSTFSDTKNK